MSSPDVQDHDEDTDYDDLENCEGFDGEKENFIWLRFIPKHFDNDQELGKVWINSYNAISASFSRFWWKPNFGERMAAYGSNLYFTVGRGRIIEMDMGKYFSILMETGSPPEYKEFCAGFSWFTSMSFSCRPICQNGLIYMMENVQDNNIYIRIWDIEKKKATKLLKIDEASIFEDDGCWPNFILHPSGQLLQSENQTIENRRCSKTGKNEIVARQSLRIKVLSLKPYPNLLDTLKQWFTRPDNSTMKKAICSEKEPRFIRDGRQELTWR